jgi:hypothetical protein
LPASFSTMHRAPSAMVTKMAVDVDPNIEIRTPRDPNTLSNYHNYVTKHTSVDFEIDFARKRLVGKVGLRMESFTDESVGVVLDSRYVDSMLKLFNLLLRLACIYMVLQQWRASLISSRRLKELL